MKKNSAFQLRSGNKPSMAQLSGVSPVKLSQFQKDVQATRARKRAELKAKRAEAKASGKPKEPSRLQKNISNLFSSIDKGLQTFLNNPRSTAAGGDEKTYVPPKRGVASGGGSGSGSGSGGTDYSKMKSVNALVADRNTWKKNNPNKKYPGQAEINKRLKKNPNKWD
tara:strand:- start:50 stop:550 length:501 start_codon:yes stop_codon:yes gene_type:complete